MFSKGFIYGHNPILDPPHSGIRSQCTVPSSWWTARAYKVTFVTEMTDRSGDFRPLRSVDLQARSRITWNIYNCDRENTSSISVDSYMYLYVCLIRHLPPSDEYCRSHSIISSIKLPVCELLWKHVL